MPEMLRKRVSGPIPRKISSFLLCFLVFAMTESTLHSQISHCANLGFEQGDFTNWTGHTWVYSYKLPEINTAKLPGIVNRRHAIMSDDSEYDANTGYKLKKIPPGYRYSARVGDEINPVTDRNPRCWNQSLRYTMTIDSGNAFLIIKFALVLQYASDHFKLNEPRFRFTLFDQYGDTIPDCSNYDVYASNENVEGWQTYMPEDAEDPVQWRDWTTVGADLLDYVGQTITLEFMSADCAQQYHYGYAYFVAECQPLYITENYCAGDVVASLLAPEGFEEYSWTDTGSSVIGTTQVLNLMNPTEGTTYSCQMTSATGCKVSLTSSIAKYLPVAGFNSHMIDCNSNTVQFNNSSATNHGNLYHLWDFGDGNISEEAIPLYTFKTSGRHRVSLILLNPPSSCTDTLVKEVESFSPPLVGISGDSTYCPGLGVYIGAYGAWDYTWSNGSKADSIEISAPGGEFWLLGRSSTGCVSDTIRRSIQEEPDWTLMAEGDTTFCEGDTTLIIAGGAESYRWNTGENTDSLFIATPGIYQVTGSNKRGCEKKVGFNVVEIPIPEAAFTLSEHTLDSKHNILTGNGSRQPGVMYTWDMGDGATETGSVIQHQYTITNQELAYTVTLTAMDNFGCTSSSSDIIDVVPFVPNVFTPNGDGINDYFMTGIELEVFDRNGLILYKGTEGWDGAFNGQPVDQDTYFYSVSYADRNQKMNTLKGFITLVR